MRRLLLLFTIVESQISIYYHENVKQWHEIWKAVLYEGHKIGLILKRGE